LEDYAAKNPPKTMDSAPVAPPGDGAAGTLASPQAFEAARQEFGKQYQEASGELQKLEEEIKRAEYQRDVNEAGAAFGTPIYGGVDDEGNPIWYEDPDTSPAFDEMEKADQRLEELRQKKAEAKNRLDTIEKGARSAGVRDVKRYGPDDRTGAAAVTTADSDGRYDEYGRRISITSQNVSTRQKQPGSADSGDRQDDRYDENGKRKKINQKKE
jgi:YD repeat-containing protein